MFIQAPGVTAEMSGDKLIALDAPGETMLTLNPVGAVIWNHLAEPRSIDDVVQYLGTRFTDVPADRLREDATAFVDELLESGLAVAAEGG